MSSRVCSGFVAAGAVATGLFFAAPDGAAQAIAYDAIAVICAVVCALGARRVPRGRRLPWFAMAGALGLWALGDVLWDVYELVLHHDAPSPSWADASYLAGYPLLAAAVLLLVRRQGRDTDALLDAAVVTVSGAVLVWQYLIVPRIASGSGILATAVDLAYPIADLAVIAVVARLATGRGRLSTAPIAARYLIASLASLLVADLVYAVLSQSDAYATGHPIDAAFLMSRVFLAAAALHPTMSEVDTEAPETAAHLGLARSIVIGASLMTGPLVVVAAQVQRDKVNGIVLAVATALLGVLVLVRVRGLVSRANAAKDRLGWVLERTGDGFFTVDFEGRFSYVNPAAEALFDTAAEDLVGRPYNGLLPEALEVAFSDLGVRAMFEENVSQTVFDPLCRRWTEVQVFTWPEGLVACLRDASGSSEEDIRTRLVARSFDASPWPTAICDLAMRIVHANPALIGLAPGAAKSGAQIAALVHPAAGDALTGCVADVRQGKPWRAVFAGLLPDDLVDGRDTRWELVAGPVLGANGALANVVVMARPLPGRTPLRAARPRQLTYTK